MLLVSDGKASADPFVHRNDHAGGAPARASPGAAREPALAATAAPNAASAAAARAQPASPVAAGRRSPAGPSPAAAAAASRQRRESQPGSPHHTPTPQPLNGQSRQPQQGPLSAATLSALKGSGQVRCCFLLPARSAHAESC